MEHCYTVTIMTQVGSNLLSFVEMLAFNFAGHLFILFVMLKLNILIPHYALINIFIIFLLVAELDDFQRALKAAAVFRQSLFVGQN